MNMRLAERAFSTTAVACALAVATTSAARADDDGRINITDAISILGFLFLVADALPQPGAFACGDDPTRDRLATCAQPSCRDDASPESIAAGGQGGGAGDADDGSRRKSTRRARGSGSGDASAVDASGEPREGSSVDDDAHRAALAALDVTPAAVDFGAHLAGSFARKSLVIRNSGIVALRLAPRVATPDAEPAFEPLSREITVAAGESVELAVLFTPQRGGDRRATLELVPGLAVELHGEGIDAGERRIALPDVRIDPADWRAGRVFELPLSLDGLPRDAARRRPSSTRRTSSPCGASKASASTIS